METNVLDLAKDKKIADFANIVKDEIRKKVMNNDYIKNKSDEINKYSEIAKTMSKINKVDDENKPESKVDDVTPEVKTDDVTPEENNSEVKPDDVTPPEEQ
jgi:cell fate (sporulation/competence/biofilm development) regulator YmcA (YheA/YmcA/DUF963 family)